MSPGEFTLGVNAEEAARIIHDGFLRALFGARPFAVAEDGKRRIPFSDADIAGKEVGLLERDIKSGVVGKLDDQDFLRGIVAARDGTHAFVAANAVLEVDDELAIGEFAEVDLRAALRLASSAHGEAAGAGVPVTAEEFGVTKDGDFRRGKRETAGESTDGKMQRVGFDRRDELAQALRFTFVVAENVDTPAVGAPLGELREESLALDFVDDEVAGLEFAEAVIVEGGGEVLGTVGNQR